MRCQSHTASVTSEETTVIQIDANPDQNAQYKARDDPGVEAILKSFGIKKVEDYVYQDDKEVKKLVSYVTTGSDTEKAKDLMKKVSQILPEFIDDDDLKTIDDAIDDIAVTEKQKRQTIEGELYTYKVKTKTTKHGTEIKIKRKRIRVQISFGTVIRFVVGMMFGVWLDINM